MVKVEFVGPIEYKTMNLNVSNLFELKQELQKIDEVKKWLDISAVAVNDTICENIDFELKSGDKIVILPPVCGG